MSSRQPPAAQHKGCPSSGANPQKMFLMSKLYAVILIFVYETFDPLGLPFSRSPFFVDCSGRQGPSKLQPMPLRLQPKYLALAFVTVSASA